MSGTFFESFVRLSTHRYWIVPVLNGLGQLGLARSWPTRERFRGHSIGTHALKPLWPFRIAYLCSFFDASLLNGCRATSEYSRRYPRRTSCKDHAIRIRYAGS